MRLGSLIRSEPFKATFRVLCIFVVLFAFASWILVKSVETTLRNDLEALMQLETELLNQVYRDEGRKGLIEAIRGMGDRAQASERVYGLFDEGRLSLAGAVSIYPDVIGYDTRALSVLSRGQVAGKYVLRVDHIDTLTLVLGRNGNMIAHARQRLVFGLAAFGTLLALGTVILGLLAARSSQRRLDEMEAALREIATGQLTTRLPVGEKNDQFDRVAIRMNANLAQLERLVSSIRTTASAIAHDLKTPLSHAQIAMHEAAEAVASDLVASEKVGAALAETDKLNGLFETVLRLSRLQTKQDRGRFCKTSLRDVAEKAISFFAPVAEENGQTLQLNGLEARIDADPDLIQQAVVNLVQNACLHAGQNAKIEVIIGCNNDAAFLTIKDDGPGIPGDEMETVRDAFTRGASDRGTPGHGLGLAIVEAIADLHSAQLNLQNTPTGFEASLIFPVPTKF